MRLQGCIQLYLQEEKKHEKIVEGIIDTANCNRCFMRCCRCRHLDNGKPYGWFDKVSCGTTGSYWDEGAVLGLISAVFNFGCGWCGLKGAKGEPKSLSAAVKLGWIELIAALVSGVLTLFGDADAERICTVAASSIVPILFLVSAKNVKVD